MRNSSGERHAAIRVAGLSVVRGGRTIIPGLDVEVGAGSVVGLLGPSGSGKTTLMRAIVGVQDKVSGTVEVLGEPAGSASLRRRVGYVTQDASVYTDLTVAQNLDYFAALAGLPARGRAHRARGGTRRRAGRPPPARPAGARPRSPRVHDLAHDLQQPRGGGAAAGQPGRDPAEEPV
jgi:ABC-type sugar transport system ATPase subunit